MTINKLLAAHLPKNASIFFSMGARSLTGPYVFSCHSFDLVTSLSTNWLDAHSQAGSAYCENRQKLTISRMNYS